VGHSGDLNSYRGINGGGLWTGEACSTEGSRRLKFLGFQKDGRLSDLHTDRLYPMKYSLYTILSDAQSTTDHSGGLKN